jgi:hypothetical protein
MDTFVIQGGPQNSMMLEAVANNPELLRSVVQAHPVLQRLIERNPQFGEVFNNPQLLGDSLRALANPVCLLAPCACYVVMSFAVDLGTQFVVRMTTWA